MSQSKPTIEPPWRHRVATAPISWGVCEVPGWGLQLPVERVLAEMAALGFTHTELGSAGWLPTEAGPLRSMLTESGLSPLGAFVPLVLHDEAQLARSQTEAAEAAVLLSEAGGRYFVTAAVTSADWQPRRPLSDQEWDRLLLALEDLQALCAGHGLEQVVHSHVGCVIETKDEVERVLDGTSAKLVLDTGHLAIGGYDPLALAKNPDRVGLVHLKDTDLEVAAALNAGRFTLMEAVQQHLFPPLGQGDLPIAEVVETLEAGGYAGWYVIEQDCALSGAEPLAGEGPIAEVAGSLAYLTERIGAFGPTGGVPSANS